MKITLRQPTDSEWHVIYDLAVAAVPWDDKGNQEWLTNRMTFKGRRQHYVADSNGQLMGYGGVEEGLETGVFRVFIVMAAEHFSTVGEVLYRQLCEDLNALNAHRVWVREYASDDTIQAFFARHGFSEQERFRIEGFEEMVVMSRSLRSENNK